MKLFSGKLFKLRKEKGPSQEVLAEKNHDKASYQQMENGQGYPETENLLMNGNSYGVSMDDLLKESFVPSNGKESGYYPQ